MIDKDIIKKNIYNMFYLNKINIWYEAINLNFIFDINHIQRNSASPYIANCITSYF